MKPFGRAIAGWLSLVLWVPLGAAAGEIEAAAREAEAKVQAGQHVEAFNTLRNALTALNANAPLGFRKAIFIAKPPQGFGLYQPRPESAFRSGEPLIVYVEPIGLGWRPEGEGFSSQFTVDFELRSPKGEILTGQKEFGKFGFNSRERNIEVMAHLTINLSGAPAGDYVFGATFHDKVSGKQASFDLPFSIK
jgi:hypothetical protein